MTDHDHEHGHHDGGHGHEHDQGWRGALRYLRWAPRMWRSEMNDAVLDLVDPRPGETVVDVGAGMGAAAVPAARSGASVIAVEPTPFLRRILSMRRLGQRHRERLSVLDGGAESLPIEDHRADAVVAVNTMHHWVDRALGVDEIARALAPGGRVVLVDEDFEDPSHPEFEAFGARHDHGDDHHGFSMIDADEMGGLLRTAGLTDVVAGKRQLAGRPVLAVTAAARSDVVTTDDPTA